MIPPTKERAASRIRAAEYVRMSTEHQKFSTENQSDAIPTVRRAARDANRAHL